MKLEPKAKPIKIRIMMGGEEHSTLEGVKRYFSLNELMPLIEDGRFERWLNQIGEREKAEMILEKKCNWTNTISENVVKEILCVLFEPECSSKTLLDIVKSWETDSSFVKVTKDVLRFLSKSNFEAAKYYYLKDENSDELWQELFSNFSELRVLEELYQDERTRKVFKDKQWGSKFATFVEDTKSFELIFKFLKSTTNNVDVMSSFCNHNDQIAKTSHEWILKEDLNSIKSYYQDESIRPVFHKYWPILFSEFVENESSFEKIWQWIQGENDANLENQFLECCAKDKCIETAKRMVDPWYVLAKNEDEYEIVWNCLDSYNVYTYNSTPIVNYVLSIVKRLSSPLAYQILDFLIQMKNYKGDYGEWEDKSYIWNSDSDEFFYPYFLGSEKLIIEYSKNNRLSFINDDLKRFSQEGCVLAKEILGKYNASNKTYPGFLDTQELAIKSFKKQLKRAKK